MRNYGGGATDRDEAIPLVTGGPDGLAEWNFVEGGELIPNLRRVDLIAASLDGADLRKTILRGTGRRVERGRTSRYDARERHVMRGGKETS